ncbi:MAG: hypothetical protein QG600_555 [Patescibacteria group bacterium]|jgi:hypothetical protein|nr:hypothetical protein [Patescibacteria group bacterium]
MRTMFYDVKTRQKIETDVTDKVEYQVNGKIRYAVKGKTSDGRNLTKFVSQSDYESISL